MIKITAYGLPQVRAWLGTLASDIRGKASEAFAAYLVGDDRHGLKHYPAYKHVSYKTAYGGFLSDRQRKKVMAMIREGSIDPGISASNGYFKDAWQYKAQGGNYEITNDVDYAPFLVGNAQQSRHSQLQGWRKIAVTIEANTKGAYRAAQAVVNAWIRKVSQR